jgi:hypothetical protein
MTLIKVERGEYPERGKQHPAHNQAESEDIKNELQSMSEIANKNAKWQLYWFYVGGVLFVIWHITEMYIRSSF